LKKEREFQERKEQFEAAVQMFVTRFQNIKDRLQLLKDKAQTERSTYQRKYQLSEEEMLNIIMKLPEDIKTIDDQIYQAEVAAESIYDNPDVIREYESRKNEIESKEKNLNEMKEALETKLQKIEEIKKKWMTEISQIVDKINQTFIQYCKNIGISGEVSLIPNEDFDKYEIQIKVKFRDSETLSTLSSFRQSGGERSVTTILYLLSLQGINKCPLRVVDEINQGMDPINERKIFLQMLEASRGEDVPQSFLITPKLLPDLVPENTQHITVLFIYNGQYNITQDLLLEELK